MMGKRWVALLTAAALITLTGFSLQGEAAPQADTLTANGSATVETTPDVVRLTLGIQEEGATPSAIWQTGWERFAAVRQALLDAGIAEEDLSGGTDLYLGQNYNDNGYPDGYRFRAVLEVTIRDAENAGSYIDTAIAAGADVGYSLQYAVSDEAALYGEALGRAVQNARTSAERLAAASGRQVGRVLAIRDPNGVTLYEERTNPDTGGGGMSDAATTVIQLGTESITAEVQVIFELT